MNKTLISVNDMTIAEPQVPLYSVEYFIRKFEAIHEDFWCAGNYEDADAAKCALGHAGCVRATDWSVNPRFAESRGLIGLLGLRVIGINDGEDPRYRQETPKARILAALHDLLPRTV